MVNLILAVVVAASAASEDFASSSRPANAGQRQKQVKKDK